MNRYQFQIASSLAHPCVPTWRARSLFARIVLLKLLHNLIYPLRNPSWPWAVYCYLLAIPASLAMFSSPLPPTLLVQRIYNLFTAATIAAVILYYLVLRTRAIRHLPMNRLYSLVAGECYIGLAIGLAHAAAPIAPQWMGTVLILGVASLLITLSAAIASCLVALGQQSRLIPA